MIFTLHDLPALRPSRRNLRWASGCVLMAYVALHLLNHAMGLLSLQAAEAALHGIAAFWHSWPGTVLLYGAAIAHIALAFSALWERRTIRMPLALLLRIALGVALPLLLASHLAATRAPYTLEGLDVTYAQVLRKLWNPDGWWQILVMVVAWTHGCMGLHFAFRQRPSWRRAQPILLTGAVVLPLMAALGVLSMGREAAARPVAISPPAASEATSLKAVVDAGRGAYAAFLSAFLLALAWRARSERVGQRTITLTYPDRTARVPLGWSVLEASRKHGIAHLSVCGGRARCSTCRVRVAGPAAHCPPPGPDEQRTLARVRAGADIRLACQLRPLGDLQVTPVMTARSASLNRLDSEREVAVLFVDLRRWSGLSEKQWPFDLVYVLDHYFALVGDAVHEAGGVANQYIGDSVMAIFGLEGTLEDACRRAVHAAKLIDERMRAWSSVFEKDFGQSLDFGIGIHAGSAAVAEVGHRDVRSFTAVGEVVNTASRLQDQTKVHDATLVISEFAAHSAGIGTSDADVQEIQVRGRRAPLGVLVLDSPMLRRLDIGI
ncbi:adenylate/guanylate cyclase domain-containing protein [Variovorax ureilyticus]|uniref:Adenylate/guanylate cyclase domain-containing protein n=1 Tax=Variovorax ureilyticus TaxID=1836198 RepID=A0ABU8VGR8_9BURK